MFELPVRYPSLCQVVEEIPLVDTHEHLHEEQDRLAFGERLDFSYLFFRPYQLADMVSSGMTLTDADRLQSDFLSQEEKWQLIAPYWEHARYTGYGRAVEVTVREVYGIPGLNEETYKDVTAALRTRNKPGVHHWIIREKAGVERCILHNIDGDGIVYRQNADPVLYRQALAVSQFLQDPIPLEKLAAFTGILPDSWEAFRELMARYFKLYHNEAVAIKNNCPYWRSLLFDDVPDSPAGDIFRKSYVLGEPLTPLEVKALQDATFHHCIRQAIHYNLPIQIHTGYLANNRNLDLGRVHPANLTNLFTQYPQARFDVFHTAYPYQAELAALAKNYPNVYIDMCWAWGIDPVGTKKALQTFIGTVPINKIFGFGGDVWMADLVYGYARLARWGVAWALAEMIDQGYLSEAGAVSVTRKILYDNAREFFDLS
ncbi:MAG: amidohydrolase family protein [Anaerolineales bacterium]|jgi:hypothetical protein